ncbi:hypothetical protein TWF718_006287 [Orbilia javanica]|uniref:Uncharacterized protein n=1 Tax=Orbilia javanica TaxID=47235 RepID=A0AAN8MW51_9PEZI
MLNIIDKEVNDDHMNSVSASVSSDPPAYPTDQSTASIEPSITMPPTSTTGSPTTENWTSLSPTNSEKESGSPSPSSDYPLSATSVGTAAGVVAAGIAILIIGLTLFYYIRRLNLESHNRKLALLERGESSRRYIPPIRQLSRRSRRISSASMVRSDAPSLEPLNLLDDHALAKRFNELDGEITDHVINYWHNGEISSRDYQGYINSEACRQTWDGVLWEGRPLLANFEARVHMFRAILAYHVYSCIADWKILTPEQHISIVRNGTTRRSTRRKMCGVLSNSQENYMERIKTIFEILEKETRLHVSSENRYDELHKKSLENIAKSAVDIGIQLGLQRDDFKFEFRRKDADADVIDDALAVKLLGESESDNNKVEVVNGMGGTVRALVSPGVTRIPSSKNREEYCVRKTHVFTA